MQPYLLEKALRVHKYATNISIVDQVEPSFRCRTDTYTIIDNNIRADYDNLIRAVEAWFKTIKVKFNKVPNISGRELLRNDKIEIYGSNKYFYVKIDTAKYRLDCDFSIVLALYNA
jgi:hypothetical protein